MFEPFRIKSVESITMTSRQQREAYLKEAGFNLFKLKAEHVMIDLLTDSGTGAMSAEQWAALMRGDESYAGARSWFRFESVMKELTGMRHIFPTHQGRASEKILFEILGGKGKVIPSNNHFDTTRAHIENQGSKAVDCVIDEAQNLKSTFPFKGDLDPDKLKKLIQDVGAQNIPVCMITLTNNSGGGQPVSLANLKNISSICREHKIPFFIDACRFAENAYFIKVREKGQENRSIREIVREIFSLADGATISAKKDGLVNIGGVLLINDSRLAERAVNLVILNEGYVTYGGLAGRDLEAMAQGFEEVCSEEYLKYRIESTAAFGADLKSRDVPVLEPFGGHAIYIDAGEFCSHIPKSEFPGQSLACELYLQAGVRSCEIGSVMFGSVAKMELVRLALPRRVYTQSHLRFVAEAFEEISKNKSKLRGFRITKEPPALRHFSCEFSILKT